MSSIQSNLNIEDIHLTEKEKDSFDYIKKKTDYLIASLYREKTKVQKCRDLYEGIRDKVEFQYLENVYGLETPMSIKMTPLIKTRIDVLVGMFLDEVFKYQVSVGDVPTIDSINEEKKKKTIKDLFNGFKKQDSVNKQRLQLGQEPKADVVVEEFLERLTQAIDNDFISEFEQAASHLIKFFENDQTIEFRQKMKQFVLDFFLIGEAYYRTYVETVGQDPVFEVCKPENIFFNKNTNYQFLSSGAKPNVTAVVHREYMTRSQVLNRWGHLMGETDKDKLFGRGFGSNGGSHIIHSPQELEYIYSKENSNKIHNQHTYSLFDTVVVWHTEWLANNEIEIDEELQTDKQNVEKITRSKFFKDESSYDGSGVPKRKGYKLDRYESIRVDYDIYLNCGRSKHVTRSEAQPWYATLSYNGVSYNDRNGRPYSLAWSMKDLQDLYDINMFHRDNLIANSGVNGSRINLAGIPKILGQDFMERVLKFVALRKQGIELIDPTEPGAALFQHYGDFNAGLDGNSVQAIQLVLESIEKQADIVSGVNRYMYQAAEQRDAVSNVKTGIKQTSIIMKDMFELLYASRTNVLTDLINNGKICYKKGKRGSYIVGHRTYLFNILPEHFCFTDFNIHVIKNDRDLEKIERVKAVVPELIARNTIADDTVIKITMSDSGSEILEIIEKSMIEKRKENDAVKQLQDQLNQAGEQMKQMQADAEKTNKELERLNTIDRTSKDKELAIRDKEATANIEYNKKNLELTEQRDFKKAEKDIEALKLEREQIYAENVNSKSREVKNDL
jgi:hypothetical protein